MQGTCEMRWRAYEVQVKGIRVAKGRHAYGGMDWSVLRAAEGASRQRRYRIEVGVQCWPSERVNLGTALRGVSYVVFGACAPAADRGQRQTDTKYARGRVRRRDRSALGTFEVSVVTVVDRHVTPTRLGLSERTSSWPLKREAVKGEPASGRGRDPAMLVHAARSAGTSCRTSTMKVVAPSLFFDVWEGVCPDVDRYFPFT